MSCEFVGMELHMAKRCRDAIPTPEGCGSNACYHLCMAKHGSDATGICFVNSICFCYYPCSVKHIDVMNHEVSSLPSHPNSADVHALTQNNE